MKGIYGPKGDTGIRKCVSVLTPLPTMKKKAGWEEVSSTNGLIGAR
jgi:hypothetical protein